jgi:streptogrisin D
MKLRPRRTLWIPIASLVCMIALPAGPAAAAPEPAALPDQQRVILTSEEDLGRVAGLAPETLALMEKQDALIRLVDRIRAQAPDSPTSGLSGVTIEPEQGTVRLYWHGSLPASVSDEIAAARKQGMVVALKPAPYTESHLLAEVERLAKLPWSAEAKTSPQAMRINPRRDGTGIDVGITGLPAGATLAHARQLVPALNSAIPLTVSPAPPLRFTARAFDSPPFWGGAYMENPPEACSNAFGVTGNNGAATYLLFAAHCRSGTWRTPVVPHPSGGSVQTTFGTTIPAGRIRHTGRDQRQDLLLPRGKHEPALQDLEQAPGKRHYTGTDGVQHHR